MTTALATADFVTGGVDTHLDVHVAADVDRFGGVLGTAGFPTTPAGFRRLLSWLRAYGTVDRIGVEGTGSYGVRARSIPQRARNVGGRGFRDESAARSSSWQERHHRCDRQCPSGDRRRGPRSSEVTLRRGRDPSNAESRAARRNQDPHCCIEPAAQPRRDRSRDPAGTIARIITPELHATCVAFRVRDDDDSLAAITCVSLRELAQRVADLDE